MIVVIGMDPGPKPGLVKLTYTEQVLVDVAVVQCTANVALNVLGLWLDADAEMYFGVEKFVIGTGSYRSGSPGAQTRDLVGSAVQAASGRAFVALNSASRVKSWAGDGRLKACSVNLLEATSGMTHARDAARHALFTAVAEAKIPDPYSKQARRRG